MATFSDPVPALSTSQESDGIPDKHLPILLVCDIQSRFRDGLPNFDHVVATAAKMISASSILGFRVIVSEQRPDVFGSTVPELGLSDLKEGLLLGTFAKTRFGMMVPEIATLLAKEVVGGCSYGLIHRGPTPLVLMGIEAHICIQQTALELADKGYEVYVLADGVSSINHKGEVPIALDRMRQAGVFVTTSESFLFSAVGDANRPDFKAFARLIKGAKPTTANTLAALLGNE